MHNIWYINLGDEMLPNYGQIAFLRALYKIVWPRNIGTLSYPVPTIEYDLLTARYARRVTNVSRII